MKKKSFSDFRISKKKRIFDVIFASLAIIILFPVMLIIALLIKITSKGPILYVSNRAGTGYEIFKFYKFRTMYVGSDQKRAELSDLNLFLIHKNKHPKLNYSIKCPECERLGTWCSTVLFIDGTEICENHYHTLKREAEKKPIFFKIEHDPRTTKLGKILRKTNLDELPQFFNVLKGDMSIVGNRPLPLYEAEKLTTDYMAYRFLAPAGITGLWQVSKNRFESEEIRISLDNQYVLIASCKEDLIIILKTLTTFFRKNDY